eukprot:TRINITY_DN1952_c1_g1_i1.p1 TRINITY_DN1952_c1_g1~~TRINITY_DN1952_c1_g1_i1.p1  ORF type:complete len:199 (-),score=36.55 TRINITY_DN1952_c1_g1_i1:159-686(-)
MKVAGCLLALSALSNVEAVQLITHRLHESSVLTHGGNSTHSLNFLQAEFQHEIEFQGAAPVVNKIYLALIVQLGLGYLGIDRCFLGQIMLGILKAVTCGGCGIWFLVDYVILTVCCVMSWKSIDMAWMRADFKEEHIENAYWVTVIALGIYLTTCLCGMTIQCCFMQGAKSLLKD